MCRCLESYIQSVLQSRMCNLSYSISYILYFQEYEKVTYIIIGVEKHGSLPPLTFHISHIKNKPNIELHLTPPPMPNDYRE